MTYPGPGELPALFWVWLENIPRGFQQPIVLLGGQHRKERTAGRRFFQDLDSGAQLLT